MGGTLEVQNRLGLPLLSYPLCYVVPRSAWKIESLKPRLPFHLQHGSIYFDILMELNSDIPKNSTVENEHYIKGYRLCLGLGNNSLFEHVAVPVVRDKITCFYYSRFFNDCNCLSDIICDTFIKLDNEEYSVCLGDETIKVKCIFNNKPESILHHLGSFTSLNDGDFISLGSVLYIEEPRKTFSQLSIESKYLHWCADIIRG